MNRTETDPVDGEASVSGIAGKLDSLFRSDAYPFHMPGHKRQSLNNGDWLDGAYAHDITEIDGFDDLQDPQGIIADLEKDIADLYGADRAYLSVNGSTLGNLSAITALVGHGGKLLMDRGAHRSVYNAVRLREAEAQFLERESLPETGLTAPVSCVEVKKQLEEAEKNGRLPDAVIVTSPTYEGFMADVEEIAATIHGYDIPLIVDSAHGAHLKVTRHADITIVSLHKTLPAMTQVSAILQNGRRVDPERIKEQINIFQTTSPSYVLIASAERCVCTMKKRGETLKERLKKNLDKLYALNGELKRLYLTGPEHIGSFGVFDHDRSKINIADRTGMLSGKDIYSRLRTEFHIQPEKAEERTCLLMTSVMDESEGFTRLEQALRSMDRDPD